MDSSFRVRLHVLGALDVRSSDGRELHTVPAQPKRAALLAYLALTTPRGFQRRDRLLSLFWPDHDTERGRNALSQAVFFLRRALGADTIVNRGVEEVGLDSKHLWCDAVAFEAALDAGHVSEALELYRGDLLEGFHLSETPDFERWLEDERLRLAGRWARGVETMADESEAAGNHDAAVMWLRRLASREPYSSRVALRLMRAKAAAGDRAGAIRHAAVHGTMLQEGLGAAPDPQVNEFARALQNGLSFAPAVAEASRANLQPGMVPADAIAGTTLTANELRSAESKEGRASATDEKQSSPVNTSSASRRRRLMLAGALCVLCAALGSAVVLRGDSGDVRDAKIRSLAVLPLENLSGDSTHESFAEGLHDALITELARHPELTVIGRRSVLRYKATTKPLAEIARELRVDGFVQGTLFWEGTRVRMNAQLVHASDRHLWTKAYHRDVRDVLLLQSELAHSIAREVHGSTVEVSPPARTVRGDPGIVPEELFLRQLFMRGRHAELSRSLIGIRTAREAYERAIARDSAFALGYAGLAGVYGFLADYAYAPMGPALDSARMMAEKAVALDSMHPETRTALAVALGDAGEFAAAEHEFIRAIELGPSNPRAHYWYTILLVALGRAEEARRIGARAAELEPFPPRGLIAMRRYADYLLTGNRRYLDSLPVRQRRPVLALEPGEPWARAREAVELAEEGRCDEARTEIAQARRLVQENNLRMGPYVGSVHWWCNERARSRALLAQMKRQPLAHEQGLRMAWLHALYGETDSAFTWLGRHRWTMAELSALRADQALDPIRPDPRFQRLLDSLGLRSPVPTGS